MLRPFRSETTEEQLTDLKDRLARTRFAPTLSGRDWTHGTPPGYLAELIDYWRTEFDWPAAENRLNALPLFLADVGGTTLHFVHTKELGPGRSRCCSRTAGRARSSKSRRSSARSPTPRHTAATRPTRSTSSPRACPASGSPRTPAHPG
ncbi:epoxide hydrolase N-terminal domain-containing protein [Amycolatopsis sp. NPDC051373]|uniref:epoxide hydrolase N-terminal domain-containing protein n=1 Tax=Amycolatopsis sp. NPDC051373 TaxID=3155801 RepID=UPI00344B4753